MSITLLPGETKQLDIVLTPLSSTQFWDKSFESGSLVGWYISRGYRIGNNAYDPWPLCDGQYYLVMRLPGNVGDAEELSQDIDLTNVNTIRFQLGLGISPSTFKVLVDDDEVYSLTNTTHSWVDYPDQEVDVASYTGVHKVKFWYIRLTTEGPGSECCFDNPTCF